MALAEAIQKHQDECRENKSRLQEGPWTHEPDRVEFRYRGYNCLMLRQPRSLHWCGYVAVKPEHPDYGKNYDDIGVSIHGGLTYSERCLEAVCRVPQPGEPDNVWWLGFDCAHAGDFTPSSLLWLQRHHMSYPSRYEHYRDMKYVKRETQRLVRQLEERACKQEP